MAQAIRMELRVQVSGRHALPRHIAYVRLREASRRCESIAFCGHPVPSLTAHPAPQTPPFAPPPHHVRVQE